MAARPHVDVTVSERRLRPIYDYLDNENNKRAVQEAEKLIKKQKDPKDVLCAKALKALALIRLSRQDEARVVIKEVHAEAPTDEGTLRAMTICYLDLHKPELIADAYEKAVKKDPHNEELLSHLFMSYVRIGDYKKQQQTAMALYKLKPKNPYYFWAVMSIVMQATSSDEKLAKSMLLPLAERMAVKFVNEEKIEAEAEVQLYLMILELQGKYEEALNVLDGPLKENLSASQDTLPQKKAELLNKMEKWPLANAAYKKLILSNPDQWSFYVEYFNTLAKIVDSGWEPRENGDNLDADYTFDQAVDLLAALVEEQNRISDGRILRGPYLAQIELLRRLLERNDERASRIGTVVDAISSYYEKFGSKPSCFLDLSHVMNTLSLSEKETDSLLEKLQTALVASDPANEHLSKDLKHVYRHICYCQMCYYLGQHENWSKDQKLAHAAKLIELYHCGLQFGTSLLPTEFQPCDNYCLLAAHIVIDIWRKTEDERYILQVMVLLEQGLKGSPSNFQMKLLLLKVYNIIGAVGTSFTLYDSVDIKHIQQETLGYLITDSLLSLGFFTTANSVLGNSIRFFLGNYKDTVDYLISCYKYGSFTKIPEIVRFREKLNNSLHYSIISVERMVLDLLMETKCQQDIEKAISVMDIDPEKDKPLDNLTDNRDVSILRVWSAKDKKQVEEQLEKSFQEKVAWLRIRNLMVRCIVAVFYLTKSPAKSNNAHHHEITNGEKRGAPEILSDLLSNLTDAVDAVDRSTLLQSFFPIQAPGLTKLPRYLSGNYVQLFSSLAELALNLHRLVESSFDAEEKSCLKIISDSKKNFQALPKKLEQMLSSNQSLTKLTKVRVFLEDFTNCVETYGLCSILISLSHMLLRPARSSLMKKGKKKKENVPQITVEVLQEFDSLIKSAEFAGATLDDLLNQFSTAFVASQIEMLSLSDKPESIEGSEEIVQKITSNIDSSYQTSISEIRDILLTKLKYLQSLK